VDSTVTVIKCSFELREFQSVLTGAVLRMNALAFAPCRAMPLEQFRSHGSELLGTALKTKINIFNYGVV